MTKCNVRLIREKSIVIYIWYHLFAQSRWRKKKKKEKRQEKQGKKQFIIFSSTRATPNHC